MAASKIPKATLVTAEVIRWRTSIPAGILIGRCAIDAVAIAEMMLCLMAQWHVDGVVLLLSLVVVVDGTMGLTVFNLHCVCVELRVLPVTLQEQALGPQKKTCRLRCMVH